METTYTLPSATKAPTTAGESIAKSIMPFAFSKHELPRDEFIDMVSKSIDREISKHHVINLVCISFLEGHKVKVNGMVYQKGVNDASFIEAIKKATL